jgi:hypothetical protein
MTVAKTQLEPVPSPWRATVKRPLQRHKSPKREPIIADT